MNIKRIIVSLIAIIGLCSSSVAANSQKEDLTKYVNQWIGTGGHGHVFLGANVPFGLVQLGPTQYTHGWDWCSGYHDSDQTVIGFSHTHLSGTGIGDLFDVTLMPVIGDVKYSRGVEDDQTSGSLMKQSLHVYMVVLVPCQQRKARKQQRAAPDLTQPPFVF